MNTADTTPCLPWSEFSQKLFWDDTSVYFVPRHHECQIASLLHLRGYTLLETRVILDFANAFGSVECSQAVRDEDRADVERLLPQSLASAWLKHEDFVWAMGA